MKPNERRLYRDIRSIAKRENLSNLVIRTAYCIKGAPSAEAAIQAAVEQLVDRALTAKKAPDLLGKTGYDTAVTRRLWQLGFDYHQIGAMLPSRSAKPKSAKTPAPTKTAPAKPTAKTTARVPARDSAATISARKQKINDRLRAEEKGTPRKSTARGSAPAAQSTVEDRLVNAWRAGLTPGPAQSIAARKKAINERLRKEEGRR